MTALLDRRSAVITGAGSGVGRASALLFAREGAGVVCADVREDWAKETVRLIHAESAEAVACRCDVSDASDVAAAIGTAVESFGRLDIMFNNAGVSTPRFSMMLEENTAQDWDRLVGINLKGVFNGCQHANIRFKEQGTGGVIVNTGSVAGIVSFGTGGVYGATKAAVIQLTRAVAIEGAPFDIRANCICPGAMPTTNFMISGPGQGSQPVPPEQVAAIAAWHPLGRAITPEDCANAALFLVGDASRNITGVALPIDGGYLAR
jgi:NAD(P)-dependent dehydrogenase (short-subunit alcohol dehydrogenase family)